MTDHDEPQDAEVDEPAEEFTDLDAFWTEERVAPRFDGMPYTLLGKDWRLPSRLPALFQVQMHRVSTSSDPEEVTNLLGVLLPEKLITRLIRERVDDRRMAILLAWATANTNRPGSLSMEYAAKRYDEREAAKQGKAARPRPKNKKRKKRGSSGRR